MPIRFRSIPWLAFVIATGCTLTAQLPKLGIGSHPGSASAAPPARSAAPTAAAEPAPQAPSVAAASADEEECPHYSSIYNEFDPKLEPLVMLMYCPTTVPRGDTVAELGLARAWLRGGLDYTIADSPALPRAVYIHLCARQMREERRLYPAMAIGCAWHASRLDHAALAKELMARPAAQRAVLAKQAADDARAVVERAQADFPKASAAREWEVFYDLPTRVRTQWIAQRTGNQKALERIVAFESALQAGKFEGCAAPLRESLAGYLHGSKTIAALATRITDPIGYALAEALARCHYYNEDRLAAGALLILLDKARRQVALAEQIYFAQLDAVAGDAEKAEKFPNLVGTKYSSVKPSDLREVWPWASELDKKWLQHKSELIRFSVLEGRVAKLTKTPRGTLVTFQKERVPLVDVNCHETNRIDSITREGKIVYRSECTSTSKGFGWSAPSPVTVTEANGVAVGRFVRLGIEGERAVVLSSAVNAGEAAQLERIADVVLGTGS